MPVTIHAAQYETGSADVFSPLSDSLVQLKTNRYELTFSQLIRFLEAKPDTGFAIVEHFEVFELEAAEFGASSHRLVTQE